jgi:hypothetical protein
MPDADPLSLRPLQADDVDLALGIAGVSSVDDPGTESFGTDKLTTPLPSLGWGVWLNGTLSGAAWMSVSAGKAEIKAVAIPRGQKGLGLTEWILKELVKAAKEKGCKVVSLSIDKGGEILGEILTDAGFLGTDPASDDYPLGVWSKPCQ